MCPNLASTALRTQIQVRFVRYRTISYDILGGLRGHPRTSDVIRCSNQIVRIQVHLSASRTISYDIVPHTAKYQQRNIARYLTISCDIVRYRALAEPTFRKKNRYRTISCDIVRYRTICAFISKCLQVPPNVRYRAVRYRTILRASLCLSYDIVRYRTKSHPDLGTQRSGKGE